MANRRKKRVALVTLGCKVNWSDGEAISQALSSAGFDIVDFDDEADAYIVNSCAVTNSACAQSRQMARRVSNRSADSLLVMMGCLGEISQEEVAESVGADAIFGTRDGLGVINYLKTELLGQDKNSEKGMRDPFDLQPLAHQSRSRAFLKIQDGCKRSCTYCIITSARGEPMSLPPTDVIDACRELSKFHNEIVLTGIDIGQYGDDLGEGESLNVLLEKLLQLSDISRLRLSSLDPMHIDERLVDLMANSGRICSHLHMSIQSCSKDVIRRMGRAYGPEDIERAMYMLTDAVPGIAITGDIIAGFPGEGDREHAQTVDLLKTLPIAGLHVFPFSARSGTRAASMTEQVPKGVKKMRAADIRALAANARTKYLEGLIGKKLEVVVTSVDSDDIVSAFAGNGVVVKVSGAGPGYGEIGNVLISEKLCSVEGVNLEGVRGIWDF